MPAGQLIGATVASGSNRWLLIPIGMVIGYYIVKAEPAVLVLNKQVEEITGGKMTVYLYLNGELGNDMDLLSQMQAGYIDLVGCQIAPVVSFVPEMAIFDLPMVFAQYDGETIDQVLNGDSQTHAAMSAAYEKVGLELLGIQQYATYRLTTAKGDEVDCGWLVAGPGRSGAEWFANQCKGLGIQLINNQVDIGVRVELPARVFEHITDVVYESKLVYRTKQYGDQVRTFCMNPYGHVVAENVEGINTVNGHSYADPALQSENTNFALLVSNRFTEPFNEPYRYGKHIASLSNMLAGGVLVQRFGDLVKGVRTNDHRMSKSFTRPTLTAAVPGDLSLALPKRQLDDIIEMIYQLDKLAPGTANYDTLLYGAEVKFYSSRLTLSPELETRLPGMFAIGDGAGITRGLAQAGASGVKVAQVISRRLSEKV